MVHCCGMIEYFSAILHKPLQLFSYDFHQTFMVWYSPSDTVHIICIKLCNEKKNVKVTVLILLEVLLIFYGCSNAYIMTVVWSWLVCNETHFLSLSLSPFTIDLSGIVSWLSMENDNNEWLPSFTRIYVQCSMAFCWIKHFPYVLICLFSFTFVNSLYCFYKLMDGFVVSQDRYSVIT